MITISHLTKIFEGKGPHVTALEDVNLEIGKGDIYGIIGMSGAGKSTLLRCLTLLERPTSGQIMLAGQDIASLSGAQLRAARRGMGVVFQGYNLLMQKTVAENVAFPLRLEKGYDKASAMDPLTTKSMLALLTDINKKLGVTIIIITHELSVVQAICSHVAVISEGRLAESGAVADVFGSPRSAVTKLLLGREE